MSGDRFSELVHKINREIEEISKHSMEKLERVRKLEQLIEKERQVQAMEKIKSREVWQ